MADTQLDRARKSLERIQSFDVSTLPRAADLGASLNFQEAVEPSSPHQSVQTISEPVSR
jgi:hypothetical protein